MKRSVVLLCGSALAALSLGASTASAVPCVPTPYVQDAHALTAQLVNPPDALVPPNVDATGCDIGIFYNDGGPHHLVNKSVFGATYYGVLSISPGTTTNITKSSMYDVGDQPTFTGTQHGISVAYRDGADGQVDHTQLYDYQKGGVLANGAGTDVQVLSNVVRGQGPTPVIAQNGVQISRGATGHVNDNLIEDHEYTGCTKQQDRAGTCTYVVSTGILLFAVEPSLVDTKNNLFRNNDVNLLNASNAPA